MLFMDWRDSHTQELPAMREANEKLPTFLYAMPFTKNKVRGESGGNPRHIHQRPPASALGTMPLLSCSGHRASGPGDPSMTSGCAHLQNAHAGFHPVDSRPSGAVCPSSHSVT